MAPAVDSEVDVVKCFPIDRVTLQVQHLLQKFLQVQLRQLQGHRRQGPTGPLNQQHLQKQDKQVQLRQLQGHRRQGPTGPLNQQHLQKQDQRPALNYYNAPESQPSCLKAACTRR